MVYYQGFLHCHFSWTIRAILLVQLFKSALLKTVFFTARGIAILQY